MIKTKIALACTLAVYAGMGLAEESADDNIEHIEVNADRIGNPVDERVSALEGAQLINADYIRAQQATTLDEALRKTTSVQVDQEGGNQGSNVIVRGLSGDQVSIRIDDVPKNFNQTRHGGANSVWIDPEIIQKITVIPGVASNIYGSGSLGGVLKMHTRDPEDAITEGQTWGGKFRQGYEFNGDSTTTGVEFGAHLSEMTSALLHYTYRDYGAYKDGDGNRAVGGSTGSQDTNLLTKLTHKSDRFGDFELTYLDFDKSFDSRGSVSRGRALSSVEQETEVEDTSWNIEHNYKSADNDWLNLNSRIAQTTTERTRNEVGTEVYETWEVTTDFAEVQNQSIVQMGGIEHQVNFGFDYAFDDIVTAYVGPDGEQLFRERKIQGLYISDRFALNESLNFVLGLRYDDFSSEDKSTGSSSENQGLFPKLHIDWRPFSGKQSKNISLFGVVGNSFRAPSVHESFGRGPLTVICEEGRRGFSCSETLANPDLKAETSDSYEIGVRYAPSGFFSEDDELYVHINYINNDMQDFIAETELEDGSIELDGQTLDVERSTFVNIDEARIWGWELAFNYTNPYMFTSLSAQKMRGEDKATGENLVDISPASVNFSLGAYLFDQKLRTGLDVSYRGEREVDEDSSFNRLSYTVTDLFASYSIDDNWKAQVRIANLFDKLYTKRYQSLSQDPETGEQTDITYYEPGRNVRLMVEYSF